MKQSLISGNPIKDYIGKELIVDADYFNGTTLQTSLRTSTTRKYEALRDGVVIKSKNNISTNEKGLCNSRYTNRITQTITVTPDMMKQQPYMSEFSGNAYCLRGYIKTSSGLKYFTGYKTTSNIVATEIDSDSGNAKYRFTSSNAHQPEVWFHPQIKVVIPSTLKFGSIPGTKLSNTESLVDISYGLNFEFATHGYKTTAKINNSISFPVYGGFDTWWSGKIVTTGKKEFYDNGDFNDGYMGGFIGMYNIIPSLGDVTNGTLNITTSGSTPFTVATFNIYNSYGELGMSKIVCNTTGKTLFDSSTDYVNGALYVLIDSASSFTITYTSYAQTATGWDKGYEYQDSSGNWKFVKAGHNKAFTIDPAVAPGKYLGVY